MTTTNPTNRKLTPEELRAHILSNTFLDPLWDASFKLLIADAAHPERLVHFLNALLRLEGPHEKSKRLEGKGQNSEIAHLYPLSFNLDSCDITLPKRQPCSLIA